MIPASIISAILAASKEMPVLSKMDQNKYGNYAFVSIDDYYEHVMNIAFRHGLSWIVREVEFDFVRDTANVPRKERSDYCIFTYEIDMFHSGGDVVKSIDRVTVIHQPQGAQTSGSARSYADKIFARSMFKIRTGEADADASNAAFLSSSSVGDPAPTAPGRRSSIRPQGKNLPAPVIPQGDTVEELEPVQFDRQAAIDNIDPDGDVIGEMITVNDLIVPLFRETTPTEAKNYKWGIVAEAVKQFGQNAEGYDDLEALWNRNQGVLSIWKIVDEKGWTEGRAVVTRRKIQISGR